MDGRPDRGNKAAFSNSSGVEGLRFNPDLVTWSLQKYRFSFGEDVSVKVTSGVLLVC